MSDIHIHDTYVAIDPLVWVVLAGVSCVAVVAGSAFAVIRRRRKR